MELILKNLKVYENGAFTKRDIALEGGFISAVEPSIALSFGVPFIDFNMAYAFPGFVDVHVHLRDPGFLYKETIRTGTLAAAHGGYTEVCAMPNLDPVPDSLENLSVQLRRIGEEAVVGVHPYGAISVGEGGEKLSKMAEMVPFITGFSDDGRGVQDEGLMLSAMREAKRLGKLIAAHCEDNSLLHGGCIHDGDYAKRHGLPGICSESEWGQIARDLRLAEKTGCAYHVCHISCRESVELIREAKRRGVDVSCETAPHYLLLDDSLLQDEGRFKMNPPIRSADDRTALIEGLLDGTIDLIATDHAPHSAEEKAGGLRKSLNGIVGLEAAFPALYTGLVRTGILSLERLMELLNGAARRRFGIGNGLSAGKPASLTVFDLDREYTLDPADFLSLGKSTPFAGERVYGRCLMTLYRGESAWKDSEVEIKR